ncbi:MAG TPA: hypothetical protein VMG12_43440 [Polyangiaceae bacterium]|nr:hypothetical protein [Polyangiaceae bacterium]
MALLASHVALSLVGIGAGFYVMYGLLARERGRAPGLERWTLVFLVTTILTSATGFLFPVTQFLPSHGVGILSLLILPVAVVAKYVFHQKGPWRWLYTVSSVVALYFNMFVLVVQLFLKVPPLHALAPTQTEPAFLIAQLLNLGLHVWLGIAVTRSTAPVLVAPTAAP